MTMNTAQTPTLMEKTADHSRALLFGLLVSCIFSGRANGRCPLARLREDLTFEEKYRFVMGLSQMEVCRVLDQHEKCYESECFPRLGLDSTAG